MKVFVAVVMFVMSSWVFVVENSPRPTPSIEEAKPKIEEAQLDKAKAGENQPVVGAIEVKPGAGQHDADHKTGEQKTDPAKLVDYQWWFNLFLVILTGGLVITGALQVRVYREQARYMREGLTTATQTAEATKEAAIVARETLRVSQRAYLGIENWRFRNDDNDIPIRIEFDLYNTGTTPARVIGTAWQTHVRNTLPPPPDYSDVVIDPMKPLLIHPKRNFTYAADLTDVLKGVPLEKIAALFPGTDLMDKKAWTDMLLKRVLQGTMPLYLSGCLVYETVDLCWMMVFLVRYEAGVLSRFTLIGEQGYNYETPCKDKK